MGCFHPLCFVLNREYPKTSNGNRNYRINGLYTENSKLLDSTAIPVPCGHCLGCRLDYSRSWADRMMLELEAQKKGIFVTLTYNNDHVPFTENEDGEFGTLTLCKRDVQLFFKRLRKKFEGRNLKYYISGEYGTSTQRPHYHAIIFGIDMSDLHDVKPVGHNELNQFWYTAKELEEAWSILKYRLLPKYGKKGQLLKKKIREYYYDPIGFVSCSEVNWKTCAYVSRYVMKKVQAVPDLGVEFFGAEKEFGIMSRRPGIGQAYMDSHDDWYEVSQYNVAGKDEPILMPRYFLNKLEVLDKDLFDKIKLERQEFANNKMLLKLLQTDLGLIDLYELEEQKLLEKVGVLKRCRVENMQGNDIF